MAYADISLSFNQFTDGPGILNGDPGNPLKAETDIVFNTDPNLMWLVPEPSINLLLIGGAMLAAAGCRRKLWSRRER